MANESNIILSVIIVSYNQERFIEKTIASVIDQRVDFQMEVIVVDDASSDRSLEIINDFASANPHLIKVLESEKNEGPYANGIKGFQQATGKYLTWIDGDDFITYTEKLQRQVDFLESNPDYQGCFHDAQIHHIAGSDSSNNRAQGDFKLYSQFNEYREVFHPWHLLKRAIIPTASLVFRNNVDLENLIITPPPNLSLNWLVQLEIIRNGKFHYFNEPWSVYNDHPDGISKKTGLNEFKKTNISILEALLKDEYYGGLERDIYESIAHEYLQLSLSPESSSISKKELEQFSVKYKEACCKVAELIYPNGS